MYYLKTEFLPAVYWELMLRSAAVMHLDVIV